VVDGERDRSSDISPSAIRQLIGAVRAHLTLSRFQAIVGITAGFISITVGLYSYFHMRPAPTVAGEVVAIVQDARTGRPVTDASVEVLTLKNAVVTTLTPGAEGRARGRLKEGTYRLRVTHPRFVAEVRQVEIVSGQTSEVRLRLAQVTAPKANPVDEAVDAVKKILK
jgi:hypothetical protein